MKRLLLPLSAALVLVAGQALAHTGHGAAAGLAAGAGHPLAGLDHVLAMVAVGILAAQLGGRALWAVPAAFLGAMILGGLLGVAAAAEPFVEQGIAISVVLLGLIIALGQRLPPAAAAALVAGFAVFHGHAHGAEMPADASGLLYGLGFALATASLHLAGIGLGLGARRLAETLGRLAVRASGGTIAAAGVYLAVS